MPVLVLCLIISRHYTIRPSIVKIVILNILNRAKKHGHLDLNYYH